jgi:DNA invertase Pin-like site-specific DNA recombinase
MEVAIYVRVSRLDLNPENQLMETEKYAKAMGYEYDVYEERESTRKTRPIKQLILQKIRNREYQGVLAWKLDRWRGR